MRLHRATQVPTLAYVALAAADTWLAGSTSPGAARARLVTKPLLMPALHLAFRRAVPRRQKLTLATEAAQALSWVGDVALLGSSRTAFLTGVGGFAGAHVGYLAAFTAARGRCGDRPSAGRFGAPLLLWTCLTPVLTRAAYRREPGLAAPVAGYATLLSAMLAASRMLDPALPRRAGWSVQTGAALFVLSDTVLATQKFVLDREVPAAERLVMATYTAAQGLIALGVSQIRIEAESGLRQPPRP